MKKMYKFFEALNDYDTKIMRWLYFISILTNLSYVYLALSEHTFLQGQHKVIIIIYASICSALTILVIMLITSTFRVKTPNTLNVLPVLLAATIIQIMLIPLDILFLFTYGDLWRDMLYLHLLMEICMTGVFLRRYVFLWEAKKLLIEENREDVENNE